LQGRLPAIIFFWHRIADDRANAWTTSHDLFTRQICWLQKHFALVSLEEAQRRIREGCNREPCVSITFDDGYADNCCRAIPWLIENRIPCTYFVTVENLLTGEPFRHDLAAGYRLQPNTMEQIQSMMAGGIEIGAHSFTHANIGGLTDPQALTREIVTAREDLQNAINQPVRYFAFPYGKRENLSRAAFSLSEAAGYSGVCSAYGGYNFPGDDPFHLQRIPGDTTMISMKNWVTLDPRRLQICRFDRRLPAEDAGCASAVPCESSQPVIAAP
jgi:peptidoglycan/xylan/chitin deacetylase (PgdA/CDA1 family)